LAGLFIAAGAMHFVIPDAYERIVPPTLPLPHLLVAVSGIAEMLGGIGLLVPVTRRAAAWSLAALLAAVFPANVYTAVAHLPLPGPLGNAWVQWVRLPLQVPLILWTLRYRRRHYASTSG
jgi:uncharacterized membrane protein